MDKVPKPVVMFLCTLLPVTVIIVTLFYIHPLHVRSAHVKTNITQGVRVPLDDCSDAYTYTIDESMKIFVCKDDYVHIRGKEHIRYTMLQWHKFVTLVNPIEYGIGIVRIDDTSYIQLKKIGCIELHNGNGRITLNLKQWLTMVKLLPQITKKL